MKNKIYAFFLFAITLLLGGCYDYKEIDETAYIVALGIDDAEKNNFSYTFQFSKPLSITNASSDANPEESEKTTDESTKTVSNLTITCRDFYIAKNMANNFLSKNVDMSHLKLIVFSSLINPADLDKHSHLLLREREVRPHTAIAVAANSASDYLKNVNPDLESNTSKYYELMSLKSNNVYSPSKRLHDFVDESSSGHGTTYLPIALKGTDLQKIPDSKHPEGWINLSNTDINSANPFLWGMVIFKNNKPIAVESGDNAMILNILNRNIEDCTFTISDKHNPQKTLSFRLVIPEKATFKTDMKTHRITVTQPLRIEFPGGILPEGYSSFDELYHYAYTMLTRRIESFFSDVTQKHSADILNVRKSTRKSFLTLEDWNNFDWEKFYRQAEFNINIQTH